MERNKINLPIETIRQNCNNDWRDAKPNFLDRVEFYCMNDEMADIYFVFKRQGKEQTRIPGHKFVFSLASEVFQKEFVYENENNAEEKKRSKQVSEIEINDDKVEIDAFKKVLIFIYSCFKNVKLTAESVFPVLYIAKKYIIKQLEKECVKYLIANIDAENIFSLLQYCADFESDIKLETKCLDFLIFHIEDVLNSEAFIGFSIRWLIGLLRVPYMNVSEVDLFKAVLKWATATCERLSLPITPENLRSVLGAKVIRLIRFPTISKEDFVDVVVPSKILTAQEEKDILLMQTDNYQPETPLPYSTISRKLEWAGTIEMPINEFTSFVGRENANLLSEPIFIGGFLWRIKTTIRTVSVNTVPQPTLGFFLDCQPHAYSIGLGDNIYVDPEWTCTAKAELKIKSNKTNNPDFSRRIEHKFDAKEQDWGFSQMISVEQLLLPGFGFINENGTVTLSADFTVDPPD